MSTRLAGVIGVAATFALGVGLFGLVRRNGRNGRNRTPTTETTIHTPPPEVAGGPSYVHRLFAHTDSHVHRLRPECKVAAAVLFVLVVVATPRETFWAYAAYAGVLAVVARRAHVPVRLLL
jgi:hypothetical protein